MPPLSLTTRYFPPGVRRVYWVPSVASILAPARAELDAGIDLTGEVRAMAGWGAVSAVVDAPNLAARFASQFPGRLALPPSSMTCYQSQDGRDVRAVLARGMAGFVAALWEGDIAGLAMDVYPVRVAAVTPGSTVEDPGAVVVDFTGIGSPALFVPVPAPPVPPPPATTGHPGVAPASGAALFSPAGATTSLTLTAINPVRATGTGLNPTVLTGTVAPAGLAAATGTAGTATASVGGTPAAAAGSGWAAVSPPT